MQVRFNSYITTPHFGGTTAIRAVSDSHQEARKECELLTKISNDAKKQNNILLLNCGDLFGGVYSRDLMVDSYLKFKETNPNVEIVMTIGNNDPISSRDKYVRKQDTSENSVDFLKNTIKKFEQNGINIVCANLLDKDTGDYPSWIKPYKVVERDGDRIFVTGFCIDRLPKSLGVDVTNQISAFERLKKSIDKENPDSIIVLNHDYSNTSRKLIEYAKNQGINIDLTIGGHDHDNPAAEADINLYNPKAFSKSMYEMDLEIKDNVADILNTNEVFSGGLPVNDELSQALDEYENKSGILEPVAPHILDLPKFYAHPGALGTFIADGIKDMSGTEAAFFASNVVRVPLYYEAGSKILNYDLRKIITFDSTVQKSEFTADELKEILTSAFKDRLKLGEQNSRFLQCSSNLKIVGSGNSQDKTYEIKQIFLNNKPLLDKNGNAFDSETKISCAFDNFIPTDGRSKALENADKTDVMIDDKKLRIDQVLKTSLQNVQGKYKPGTAYKPFVLEETIV